MILDIKIPSPGESITEVEIGNWLVKDGEIVTKDQDIAEIESDKATLSLTAPASGKLKILLKEGERVAVGSVACAIDTNETIQDSESGSILLNKESASDPIDSKSTEASISALPKTEEENMHSL